MIKLIQYQIYFHLKCTGTESKNKIKISVQIFLFGFFKQDLNHNVETCKEIPRFTEDKIFRWIKSYF